MTKFETGISIALWLLFASSPEQLAAQSTGTLTGTVTDPSGSVVAGAAIVCTNVATNQSLHTVTSAGGLFRLPDAPVGLYAVRATHPGFETLVQDGVDLLTGHTVDLSLVLRIGETTQSVVVSAPAPLVQTTTSEVQTTIDSRQMSDLPLNGRNAFQLAVLVPGAVGTDADSVVGQQDNGSLAVNGLRPVDNNWQLDGGTYINITYGSAPTLPDPDTLQEFTMMTSNFSADNRGAGAAVKLTTRSGTNQFHGTAFEFLRNTALDARNFFSLTPDVYRQNQYGGTLGGPIRKNKLFFFGSYQGTTKRGSPSPVLDTVPSPAQHAGNFAATGHTIVDPATGAPFPNDAIPQSRWDPAGAKMLAAIPLPNSGANTLVAAPPANKDDLQYMGKIDYTIGAQDRLSARYFWDQNRYQRDVTSLPGFYGQDQFRNQTALVAYTHTFSPTWVMENSFNYLQTFRTEFPEAPIATAGLGINAPLAQSNVPNPQILVTLSGYTRLYSSRTVIFNPAVSEFQSNVSHAAGNHFIRSGGGLRFDRESTLNLGDPWGAFTFSAQRNSSTAIKNSGDAIAALLLGVPQTFTQSASVPTQQFRDSLFNLWVQDDWKIRRGFTVNMGLRYDPWLPPSDSSGPLVAFAPGIRSTIAPLAPAGMLFSGDPGIPSAVFHNHWNEFGPRVGFAWDVTGKSNTVVRAGYGVFQMGPEAFNQQRTVANNNPVRGQSISITSPSSTENPYTGYPGGSPFPFTAPSTSQLSTYKFPAGLTVYSMDPNYRPGYTQSWNFTFERRLRRDTALTIAYVGNHFLGSLASLNENIAPYGPGATLANESSRFIYQGFSKLYVGTGYNHGTYNGLQIQLTKRPTRGLTLLASYTWAKALDLNSSMSFGAVNDQPRDPFNANLDKGPDDFDVKHSLKVSAVYDLPKMTSGNRAVRAALNGWQVDGILTARTGFPFTCRSGGDNSLTGVGLDTCDQVLTNIARPAGVSSLQQWFNTAAFTPNAIGTLGNTGRGILRRPGLVNLDASVFKHIPITDRLTAELRVETFNVVNHPNFDLFYNTGGYTDSQTVGSATFGKLQYAADPRVFQVAAKLRF